jgi:hypothetical protein
VNLQQTFQDLIDKGYPHGKEVAVKVAQLFDFYLTFEQPAAENVIGRMISTEEVLLQRPHSEMVQKGSVIKSLKDAMVNASNEEWQAFVTENRITPLSREERLMVFQFESGILGEDFTKWVYGQNIESSSSGKEKE